jgi:DNA-binding GntR family transcriptional regulator
MRVRLDRKSKVPLYRQIKEHVRQMLTRQEGRTGKVAFTEQELAKHFDVSRMTVRQAIRDLVDEGLVYRVRGVGTFLTSPKLTDSLQAWRNRFEDWALQGRSVAMEILDFRIVEAGHDVARRLRLPEHTEVLHIPRVWYVDGMPLGLSYFYLHPSLARILARPDVENQHMWAAVSKCAGLPVLGEEVEIEAGVASHVTATRLKIATGDPVLIRRLTQFYGDWQPLVAANCFYRADLYRYSVYVPAQAQPEDLSLYAMASGPVVHRAVAGHPAGAASP